MFGLSGSKTMLSSPPCWRELSFVFMPMYSRCQLFFPSSLCLFDMSRESAYFSPFVHGLWNHWGSQSVSCIKFVLKATEIEKKTTETGGIFHLNSNLTRIIAM